MFDRVNKALLRYIERKRGAPGVAAVELADEGFVVRLRDERAAPLRVRWGQVQEAAGVLVPGPIGGEECLLVDCGETTVQLTPDVDGFEAFVAAAARHLPGWKDAAQWRTELIAAGMGAAVAAYRRNEA
jgi:hypothetical protein